MPDDLLPLDAVAEELNVKRATLWDWRLRSVGPPSFKLRGRVYYRRAELDAWIADEQAREHRYSTTALTENS